MPPHNNFVVSKSQPSPTLGPEPVQTQRPNESSQTVLDAIKCVQARIAPVWPLEDYVAVNPYMGFEDTEFLATRLRLQGLSDLEMFMPVDYYRQQYQNGEIQRSDLANAVDELVADSVENAEQIDVNQVVSLLQETSLPSPTSDSDFGKSSNEDRTLFTLVQTIDMGKGTNWSLVLSEEISKQCSAHYDLGQAAWTSADQGQSLYSAWRSAKQIDRTLELLGVSSFRSFVQQLPEDANSSIVWSLEQLGMHGELWEDYLLCVALTLPGWSAWTKYQDRQSDGLTHSSELAGLLAIHLAYEVAICKKLEFATDWWTVAKTHRSVVSRDKATTDVLLRYALLRAAEIAFRRQLVDEIARKNSSANGTTQVRSLAQMVFCIDVRSERIRRNLESLSQEIDTFGFAGFFGLPIEWKDLGADKGQNNLPVLLSPKFQVQSQVDLDLQQTEQVGERFRTKRTWKSLWKSFQSSAISMFAFVETNGLLFAPKLIARAIGVSGRKTRKTQEKQPIGPALDSLAQQGVGLEPQTDMAEAILRGIGIVDRFARLVVLCGHGTQVVNNPLQAGLECGACGGHSGEPNARLAARLLNQPEIREELAKRGIQVPAETHFTAALHVTTTDRIEFLDAHLTPQSHVGDLEELRKISVKATEQTRLERLPTLHAAASADLDRRSQDWSEVRPEWGLAGNAVFIVAPRELTRRISLEGRSFLHSYNEATDQGHSILEQIMTAPMIVANWINMQYYASTVDPNYFGSGNKTVHNVVGQFGILSGNGGDLQTGLPWQSVHDGKNFQHHPLRLQVIIAAQRKAIEGILSEHPNVANLVTNGWLQLMAIEADHFYRYTSRRTWDLVDTLKSAKGIEVVAS